MQKTKKGKMEITTFEGYLIRKEIYIIRKEGGL